jgi:hypothetical protein
MQKFNVTLGEHSLIQPYREFLIDALLAECNRSTCFDLKENVAGVIPDSAFVLDVKVEQNQTNSEIKISNSLIILPIVDATFSFASSNHLINPAISDLKITARLMQRGKHLWEKTYSADIEYPQSKKGMGDSFAAYDTCLNNMSECLSMATKQIVDNISRDLHVIMLGQK